jgi:uncharacterized protein YqeY
MKNINQRIEDDLKKSLKDKNELAANSLRMVKSVIKNAEIEKRKDLTDEEIIDIISKEVKKRKEAADLYKKGDRDELAAKEESEINILKEYLPEGLSEDGIRKIVQKTISELGAAGPGDRGRVMGALMPQLKNKADGSEIARITQEELSK